LVVAIVGSLVAGVAPVGAQDLDDGEIEPPDWAGEVVPSGPGDDPVAPPIVAGESAPLAEDEPMEPATVVFPSAGVSDLTLGGVPARSAGGEFPVSVGSSSDAFDGAALSVEVKGPEVAERAGVSGFVFEITGAGGADLTESLAAAAGRSLPLEGVPASVSLDYSAFAQAYGSGYVERMRVVALPACAVAGPPYSEGCDRDGTTLPQQIDRQGQVLDVEIEDLVALDSRVLASDAPGARTVIPDASLNGVLTPSPMVAPGTTSQDDRVEEETSSTTSSSVPTTTTSTSAPAPPTTTSTTATSTPSAGTTPEAESPAVDDQGSATTTSSSAPEMSTTTTLPEDLPEAPEAEELGEGDTSLSTGETQPENLSTDAAGGVVLALTSGTSSQLGNYEATPFSASHSWEVGIGSGEFSWNYPIPVTEAPAGPTPSLSVGYSSGAVDGLTSARNTEAGPLGVGWGGFGSNFIERRYIPCAQEDPNLAHLGDLCWKDDNAFISLNGVSSELVRDSSIYGFVWRLKNDPGWTVERRTSSPSRNGDNDGEHWIVRTPDGTEYWFGSGLNPENGNAATNSAWTVAVVGNNIYTDPCSGGGLSACNQAWRWNLDRVVDPDGNYAAYTYWTETNKYLGLGGLGDSQYVRGGRLWYVEYGAHVDATSWKPTAKVVLDAEWRCVYLSDGCPAPQAGNPGMEAGFPDVPGDLMCATNCLLKSPTFFTAFRYTKAHVYRGTGTLRESDEIILRHGWFQDGDGNSKLELHSIQRIGKLGTNSVALPPVEFTGYVTLANRVDFNESLGVIPLWHPRLSGISDEYGGRTEVSYVQPRPCSQNPYPNGGWDYNDRDCFAQYWTPYGSPSGFAIFNKYLTGTVRQVDPTGGSPDVYTNYLYNGGAAWHHMNDKFVPAAQQSWSDWRGYGTVSLVNGTGAPMTKFRVFRGLNADKCSITHGPRAAECAANGGVKTSQIRDLTEAGQSYPDWDWMRGRVLESRQYAIDWTTILTRTVTTFESRQTVTGGSSDWRDFARWTDVTSTTDYTRAPGGAFVHQTETTTYDTTFQPATRNESGWQTGTIDDRCTLMSYASNSSRGMFGYPASQKVLAGGCSSSDVLSEVHWFYDNLTTLGQVGDHGRMTLSRARVDTSTWGPDERVTYDTLGRPASTTDRSGRTSTVTHTPTTGFPSSTTTTSPPAIPNAAGHSTTTVWQPERGVPASETDANGKVTSYDYDPLGRLTSVRLPTEQTGTYASIKHTYDVSPNKGYPPVIIDQQLADPARSDPYEYTWTIYDTSLRERQTQQLSPQTGKVIVAETVYDARGMVKELTSPQAVSAGPGPRITGIDWENLHRFEHDELGRITDDRYVRGGVEQWSTETTYTHNAIQVNPPAGGDTLTVLDAYGRPVQESEHDGNDWVTTTYEHDLAGNLRTITDPAGNTTSYTYDMLGRRLIQDDPDSGSWSYGYDTQGNQNRVTDAAGNEIHTLYDGLDRPIERHADSPSGPLLVSWAYDAPGELGMLNSATRHTPVGDWITDVLGYDARNRPIGSALTVPASVTGLTGTYTTTVDYDSADRVVETSYPAVGGLPQETVTATYNSLGLPETLVGLEEYVWGTSYDDRGRPTVRSSGSRTNWIAQKSTYDTDQRLARLEGATPSALMVDHTFTYDDVGNITERNSSLVGFPWRECFNYNDQQRLTLAYTVDATSSCADGSPGAGAFGYDHTYAYGDDGNLLSRAVGGETTDYTYPDPGTARPHAPTAVGADQYDWDANGNLVERTVDDETETLAWSAEGLLESVTGQAGSTSFTYGTDGQRLLRTTPDGTRTLYLGAHEVQASADGTTVQATRLYTFADQLIATRATSGVDYLLSDQQGSIEAAVPSGTSSTDGARLYLPYGDLRAEGGTGIDTDRGWLGQSTDASTDLSYLNARYYDPTAGVFISPDPLLDPSRPKSLNPYAYGHGNPSTNTDKTGLAVPVEARNNSVIWDARFNAHDTTRVGAFAGNTHAMIRLGIKPGSVSRRQHKTYKPAYDANTAFWHLLATNPGARAYFGGLATLKQMHSACPTTECAGLYQALAEVGAEGLQRIADGIERERQQKIRIQAQKDRALASHVKPPDNGGCSGFSLCQVGGAWDATGGEVVSSINEHRVGVIKGIGVGLTVAAVIAAPFSGGLSLGLAVGATSLFVGAEAVDPKACRGQRVAAVATFSIIGFAVGGPAGSAGSSGLGGAAGPAVIREGTAAAASGAASIASLPVSEFVIAPNC
jgi:RHS repeat-associated protein